MKSNRVCLVAGVAFAALALGLAPVTPQRGLAGLGFGPSLAQAQNLGLRVVSGKVVDGDSAPMTGATVFLKSLKTKSIRSYNSTADGKFRFVQVDMAEDYEIWAEKDGKKSATKTISTWDTRKEYECELKVK